MQCTRPGPGSLHVVGRGRPVLFGRWPCRCSDQLVEECGRPIWSQTDFCFPSNLACLLGEVGLFLGRLFTLWLLIGWGRPAFLSSFPWCLRKIVPMLLESVGCCEILSSGVKEPDAKLVMTKANDLVRTTDQACASGLQSRRT